MSETQWDKLGAYLKETQILGSIQNTLYWDQNTVMPKKGASWRSEQLTYIIEEANQISEKLSPWETLAQPFEPELTQVWMNKIFKPLKEIIPSMLSNLNQLNKHNWDLEPNSQYNLCSKLLDEFGRNKDLIAVAESPHPFSITLGPDDYRITTRIVKANH